MNELKNKFKTAEKLEVFLNKLQNRYGDNEHGENNFTLNDLINNSNIVFKIIQNNYIDDFNDLLNIYDELLNLYYSLFDNVSFSVFKEWTKNIDIRLVYQSHNGLYFKDFRDFNTFNDDDIIYIPEYDLTELTSYTGLIFDINEVKQNKAGETLKDLKDLCNNDLTLMRSVFDIVDWQSFSSVLDEVLESYEE